MPLVPGSELSIQSADFPELPTEMSSLLWKDEKGWEFGPGVTTDTRAINDTDFYECSFL